MHSFHEQLSDEKVEKYSTELSLTSSRAMASIYDKEIMDRFVDAIAAGRLNYRRWMKISNWLVMLGMTPLSFFGAKMYWGETSGAENMPGSTLVYRKMAGPSAAILNFELFLYFTLLLMQDMCDSWLEHDFKCEFLYEKPDDFEEVYSSSSRSFYKFKQYFKRHPQLLIKLPFDVVSTATISYVFYLIGQQEKMKRYANYLSVGAHYFTFLAGAHQLITLILNAPNYSSAVHRELKQYRCYLLGYIADWVKHLGLEVGYVLGLTGDRSAEFSPLLDDDVTERPSIRSSLLAKSVMKYLVNNFHQRSSAFFEDEDNSFSLSQLMVVIDLLIQDEWHDFSADDSNNTVSRHLVAVVQAAIKEVKKQHQPKNHINWQDSYMRAQLKLIWHTLILQATNGIANWGYYKDDVDGVNSLDGLGDGWVNYLLGGLLFSSFQVLTMKVTYDNGNYFFGVCESLVEFIMQRALCAAKPAPDDEDFIDEVQDKPLSCQEQVAYYGITGLKNTSILVHLVLSYFSVVFTVSLNDEHGLDASWAVYVVILVVMLFNSIAGKDFSEYLANKAMTFFYSDEKYAAIQQLSQLCAISESTPELFDEESSLSNSQ